MDEIVIDFETRSPVDIKKCGAYKYAQHPDTDVTMLCILDVSDKSKVRVWIGRNFRHLYDTEVSDGELDEIIKNAKTIIAHNCPFERAIWKYIMVDRYGFKPMDVEKTVDTAVMCSMVGLPRQLEKASEIIAPEGSEKDMEGSKIMKRFMAPKKPTIAERRIICPGNPEYAEEMYNRAMDILSLGGIPDFEYHKYLKWHEDKNDFIRTVEYCRRDVLAEYYLYMKLPRIHTSEHDIWVLDQEINDRGICIDIESAKGISKTISRYQETLMNEALELTDGAVTTMKSPKQIKEWLLSEGIETDSIDKASIEFLLTLDLNPKVRRFLEIRQTLGKSSIAKYDAMFACASNGDNRVRGIHAFYGAQTARWAGRLLQTQNLPRPSGKMNLINPDDDKEDIDEQTIHLMSSGDPSLPLIWFKDLNVLAADCIRGMLMAPKGRDFICADFNSIESRAAAYIANEETELDAYRNNKDIYKVNASSIYGISYEEVDGGGKGPQRQVGKTATLACLAGDTKVLTKRGYVKITDVVKGDEVWDGDNWVHTDGCICRGKKECVEYEGVYATRDHLWLMEDGTWERTDGLKRISERYTGILRLLEMMDTKKFQENIEFLQNAQYAEALKVIELTTLKLVRQQSAKNVRMSLTDFTLENTQKWMSRIVREIYTGYGTLLQDARDRIANIGIDTVEEEYLFVRSGKITLMSFLDMQRLLRGGIIANILLTESIMTETMNQEIYDSYQKAKVQEIQAVMCISHIMEKRCALRNLGKDSHTELNREVSCQKCIGLEKHLVRLLAYQKEDLRKHKEKICKTYDLLNCGPNHRFTIMTNKGPRIVHNCSYGGGLNSLMKFSFDKIPVTEKDMYHAIQQAPEVMQEDSLITFVKQIYGDNYTDDYVTLIKDAYENPKTREIAEQYIKEIRGTWIVKQWRKAHPKVVQLWYDMKRASIDAVLSPKAIIEVGDKGVNFRYVGNYLIMRLPSGRPLFYMAPEVEEIETPWGTKQKVVTSLTMSSVTHKMERRQLNISILVENLVQAFCRDLLRESMLRLDKNGYDIVAHIHDEVLSEVDEGKGSVEEYEALMSITPTWAEGMPLKAAGGYRAKRYRK